MFFTTLLRRFFARSSAGAVDKSRRLLPVYAPISGRIVPLESVPDAVFSEKKVGDGVAIEPSDEWVVSPVAGTIGTIIETRHAFSICSEEGLELFVHVGIDTVNLRGKGFTRLIAPGSRVQAGTPILQLDLPLLVKSGYSLLTPVILANLEVVQTLRKASGTVKAGESIVFSVTR